MGNHGAAKTIAQMRGRVTRRGTLATSTETKPAKQPTVAALHAQAAVWQHQQIAQGASSHDIREAHLSADGHDQGLVPIVNAGEVEFGRVEGPATSGYAQKLLTLFGERQLAVALNDHTIESLRTMATHIGVEPSKTSPSGRITYLSRNELLTRMTMRLTNGHYSADIGKLTHSGKLASVIKAQRETAKATRASKPPKSAVVSKSRTTPEPKSLIPIVSAGEVTLDRINDRSAYLLQRIYGNSQLRDALQGYALATLKSMAAEVQARNPGTAPKSRSSKAAVTDYIVERLTEPSA